SSTLSPYGSLLRTCGPPVPKAYELLTVMLYPSSVRNAGLTVAVHFTPGPGAPSKTKVQFLVSVQRPLPVTESTSHTTCMGAGAAASPKAATDWSKVALTISTVATVPCGENCAICAA